jgi:hypothetical protein
MISAYFNSIVTVKIHRNERISPENQMPLILDRMVEIASAGRTRCVAESIVTITDPHIADLIVLQKVGIGQLFRHLKVLPDFELLDLQRESDSFWRLYVLESKGISCKIKETFPNDIFHPSEAVNQRVDIEKINGTSIYDVPQ